MIAERLDQKNNFWAERRFYRSSRSAVCLFGPRGSRRETACGKTATQSRALQLHRQWHRGSPRTHRQFTNSGTDSRYLRGRVQAQRRPSSCGFASRHAGRAPRATSPASPTHRFLATGNPRRTAEPARPSSRSLKSSRAPSKVGTPDLLNLTQEQIGFELQTDLANGLSRPKRRPPDTLRRQSLAALPP